MIIGRLHVLTDYHFQQRFSHAELASRAIQGGADTIQFRQKEGPIRHLLVDAQKTAAVCKKAGVPLIVNDRIDLALAVDAAGAHVGQEDMPVTVAREVLGPDRIVGATATTVEQAVEAEAQGASYIGFGPVYRTKSKANPSSVKGLQGLAAACRAVAIPVIAIAGMTPSRARQAIYAGAHGVAVMTGVTLANDPAIAAQAFRRSIDFALG